MTYPSMRRFGPLALAAPLLLGTAGCDDFLTVSHPMVIDAGALDPAESYATLSLSARQNLAVAFGWTALNGGWFTQEIWVGDSFATRNAFALRTIDGVGNTTLAPEWWSPLQLAISSNEFLVADAARSGMSGTIDHARALYHAGYAILLNADHFCDGVVGDGTAPGDRYSTEATYELALARFRSTREIADGLEGEEAHALRMAARVGEGRSLLQMGRGGEAAAAVAEVPAEFEFDLTYVDDPSFRGRLGNRLWNFTAQREAVVVPPAYREMEDPRVLFEDAGRGAQDGFLPFFRQLKYPGWDAPVRIASGLEARYIAAEGELLDGGNPGRALALIAERRTAGDQPEFAGSGQEAILAELLDQRSRDFWLEAQRMGDFRRHGEAIPHFLPSGAPYYKPGLGNFGTDACVPVPRLERDNNPNF